MQTYNNDYTQKEDFILWELHEIRAKMAKDNLDIAKINKFGADIISRYGMKNVKLIKQVN